MEYKYTGDKAAVMFRGLPFVKDKYRPVPEDLVLHLDDNPNFTRKTSRKKDEANDA